MSKTNKIAIILSIVVVVVGFLIYMVSLKPVNLKDVALKKAVENFFYIREESEPYIYSIKELKIGNYERKKGEHYIMYEIEIVDDDGNEETYLIGIWYKRHILWSYKSQTIPKKNIIDVKLNHK